jgi:hypothetical protein
MLAAMAKNKSVRPDSVSGEILKLDGEPMISYLALLMDIINNAIIPSDWKKAIVVPIYKGVTVRWSRIKTCIFNFSGLQANGTRYCIVPEENLG